MDVQAVAQRLGGMRPVVGDKLIPMSEADIATIEAQIGERLPANYRKFLATFGACAFNGGSPDNPYIVFCSLNPLPSHISKTGNGLFDVFYGTKSDETDPYSLQVRIRYFAGRMPDSIIPIGDDGGAGQICLGIKGREAGKVYYWDQANEPLDADEYLEDYGKPRPQEAMFENVHQIAESFDDFLERLQIMER